jgi:hypothetical protein
MVSNLNKETTMKYLFYCAIILVLRPLAASAENELQCKVLVSELNIPSGRGSAFKERYYKLKTTESLTVKIEQWVCEISAEEAAISDVVETVNDDKPSRYILCTRGSAQVYTVLYGKGDRDLRFSNPEGYQQLGCVHLYCE